MSPALCDGATRTDTNMENIPSSEGGSSASPAQALCHPMAGCEQTPRGWCGVPKAAGGQQLWLTSYGTGVSLLTVIRDRPDQTSPIAQGPCARGLPCFCHRRRSCPEGPVHQSVHW